MKRIAWRIYKFDCEEPDSYCAGVTTYDNHEEVDGCEYAHRDLLKI